MTMTNNKQSELKKSKCILVLQFVVFLTLFMFHVKLSQLHIFFFFFFHLFDDVTLKSSDPQAAQGAGRLPGEGFRPDHAAQCQCKTPLENKTQHTSQHVTAATPVGGKVHPEGNIDAPSSLFNKELNTVLLFIFNRH